jgi:hypothetical protein
MSNLITMPLGALPAAFAGQAKNVANAELSGGITGGFAVLSLRGKSWRVKHRGEERIMMRDDGDGARSSLEVVLVKAAPVISKIFYQTGYVEGSNSPPDCWSTNGVTPDAGASKKQSATCAGCPHNAWGSRITDAGKAGKACADSKRLALVPAGDIDNEVSGGPMLLRIPAASLQDLTSYAAKLNAVGYPYYAVVTRIAFDPDAEYPKVMMNAVRALTDEEAAKVAALRDDARVGRILNEAVEMAEHQTSAPPALDEVFEKPPVEAKAAPKAEPKAEPKPAATKTVVEHSAAGTTVKQAAITPAADPTQAIDPAVLAAAIAAVQAQQAAAAPKAEPKPVVTKEAVAAPVTQPAEEGSAPAPVELDAMLDGLLE